jgi:hypothetical protein
MACRLGVWYDCMDPRQSALHRTNRALPMDPCGIGWWSLGVLSREKCISNIGCGEYPSVTGRILTDWI